MIRKKCLLISFLITAMLSLPPVWAVNYDIKEMTPEIRTAISNRQARYGQLAALKQEDAVGENNQGFVEVLGNQSAARELVEAENKDRLLIYRAIVEQNKLEPGSLEQVQAVFADVQRERAEPGDSIQLPTGEWTKK
jgi:hypothetical protein